MRKITKKTIKSIKRGNYSELLSAFEFLLDTYNEDKFDAGYKSAMEDLSVRSYLLAEFLHNRFADKVIDKDETAKAIEDYYTKALKQK